MGRIKLVTLFVLVSFVTLTVIPPYAKAEENQMKTIFMDTFYGMAAGALISAAISLTQDNPDWGENVGTGAAIGGIAGALFGIATEVRYLVGIEDGHVYTSVPSIKVDVDRKDGDGVIYTAGIFQYKF